MLSQDMVCGDFVVSEDILRGALAVTLSRKWACGDLVLSQDVLREAIALELLRTWGCGAGALSPTGPGDIVGGALLVLSGDILLGSSVFSQGCGGLLSCWRDSR